MMLMVHAAVMGKSCQTHQKGSMILGTYMHAQVGSPGACR